MGFGHTPLGLVAQDVDEITIQTVAWDMHDNDPVSGEDAWIRRLLLMLRTYGFNPRDPAQLAVLDRWEQEWLRRDARTEEAPTEVRSLSTDAARQLAKLTSRGSARVAVPA